MGHDSVDLSFKPDAGVLSWCLDCTSPAPEVQKTPMPPQAAEPRRPAATSLRRSARLATKTPSIRTKYMNIQPVQCRRTRRKRRAAVKRARLTGPPLSFADFVAERVKILRRRHSGEAPPWSADTVLQQAAFCNIDRKEDFVTRELLAEMDRRGANPECTWQRPDYIALVAVLRFTGSRRGEAATIASLIDKDRSPECPKTTRTRRLRALEQALRSRGVRGGNGAYQITISQLHLAEALWRMCTAVDVQVKSAGPFADVKQAATFLKALMTTPEAEDGTRGRAPSFSSTETAKDFEYFPERFAVLCPHSGKRCHLGPGARKGLTQLRKHEGELLPRKRMSEEATFATLSNALKTRHAELSWMQPIDVEQALCEYAKYVRYRVIGISPKKRFHPSVVLPADKHARETEERC
mmetsp:Transcript_35187/g.109554  ORF Transcript_35187/g.109554 Transcript_35187/m.109554 type:complete len:410 (-) Transcript_35187:47-1276(-)